jgi:hypothetical protein
MYISGLSFAVLQAGEMNGEHSHRAPAPQKHFSQYHEQSTAAAMLHITVRVLSIYLGQDIEVFSSEEFPRKMF